MIKLNIQNFLFIFQISIFIVIKVIDMIIVIILTSLH
jgi:hypothetical protein